jgi:hypothetical protein
MFCIERIARTNLGMRPCDPASKAMKNPHFSSSVGDQMEGVDASSLTDPIDATDSLFEPHWIPWQFEIHYDPAVVVKIQPLAGRIGSEQDATLPKLGDRRSSFFAGETAVKKRGVWCDVVADMDKGVAIFREHDGGFFDAANEPREGRQF